MKPTTLAARLRDFALKNLLRAAALGGLAAASAYAGTSTWNGGSGNWSNSALWTSTPAGFFPNNGNSAQDWTATINSGTATVDQLITLDFLNFNGGVISRNFDLTVTDGFNWTGGTLAGGSALNLSAGSVSTMSGTNAKILFGGALNLAGTMAWTGTGSFQMSQGTTTVQVGGLFEIQTDADIGDASNPTFSALAIDGTLRKSGGSLVTTIGGDLGFGSSGGVNTTVGANGVVEVQSGTLQFLNGLTHAGLANATSKTLLITAGGSGAGAFNADAGGVVQFNGGTYTLHAGAAITGAGRTSVTGGRLDVANLATVSAANFGMSSGNQGGLGTLNISGTLDWTGGTFDGGGTTTLLAGATATLSGGAKTLLNRSLNLGGNATWTGGNLQLNQGSVTVQNGALFDIQTAADIGDTSNPSTAALTINAGGILRKSVDTGQTDLGGDLGAGSSGGVVTTVNSGGRIEVQAGVLNFIGSASSAAGTLDVSSGTMNSTGATQVASGGQLNLLGAANKVLSDRPINVAGVITLSDTGNLHFYQGTMTVQGGGLLDIQSDADIGDASNATFANLAVNGTLLKSGGVGLTLIGGDLGTGSAGGVNVTVGSGGTVDVASGTLQFVQQVFNHAGTTLTGGIWKVRNGGSLVLTPGSNITINAANVELSGAASTFAKINTLANNQGSFTITNGKTFATVGVLANSGTITVGPGGTLSISGAYTQSGGSTFLDTGTITATSLAFNNGSFGGTGSANGSITFAGSSILHPGTLGAAGLLTLNNNTSLNSTSSLRLDIGGLTAGTQYDLLDVNASMTLGGALSFGLFGGFTSAVTAVDTFTVLTANSLLGSFANVSNGARLANTFGDVSFKVNYGAGSAFDPNAVVLSDVIVYIPVDALSDTCETTPSPMDIAVQANDVTQPPHTIVSAVTQGAHGAVTILPGGVVRYTPGGTFTGSDIFTYTLLNGPYSDTATVTIQDTTDPVVTAPASVIAEATGPAGAAATYANATASDAVGVGPIIYTQSSGTVFPLGITTVTATATDLAGHSASANFTVTVQDTTPPVVTVPANVIAEATSPGGALATYANATASDAVSASTLLYSQASGSLFPLGTTTVFATATDATHNSASASFTVTVQDTTPPVVTPPANVFVEATNAAGALASYGNATATEAVGVSTLLYSQASGSLFPLGATIVTATATDAANQSGAATFTVTVQDTIPPVVTAPANVVVEATGPAGAVASFGSATATDAVGANTPTYSHVSGSVFPIGVTTVTATATDAANNSGVATFTVTVRDTVAPVLTLPSNIIAEQTGPAGALVTFSVSATDLVDVSNTQSTPASGSVFPPGTTTVNVVARDAANNEGTGSFTVTVSDTTPPVLTVPSGITVYADGTGQAIVNYPAATAVDNSGGPIPIAYAPGVPGDPYLTGSTFGLGTRTVVVTGTDASTTGIFLDNGAGLKLRAAKDQEATDASGTPMPGVTWATLKDPLIDATATRAAFLGSLRGPGVHALNSSGLWVLDATGVRLAVREGDVLPGTGGARVRALVDVVLPHLATGPSTHAYCTLKLRNGTGSPGVTAANDLVLCSVDLTTGAVAVLLRDGGQVDSGFGLRTVRDFVSLSGASGSAGAQRAFDVDAVPVRVRYADATAIQQIVLASPAGLTAGPATGTAPLGLLAARLRTLGVGAISGPSAAPTFAASLATGPGGVSGANNAAIFNSGGPVARKGTAAPGAGRLLFSSFKDPVALEDDRCAFTAKLDGAAPGTTWGLWRQDPAGQLALVAREGTPAPQGDGAVFKSFANIAGAAPGVGASGLIFTANLVHGVAGTTSANDFGLWATANDGSVVKVLREGDTFEGKTVRSIFALGTLGGSPQQARAYTTPDAGGFNQVIVRVFFTDGTSAIARLAIP